MSDSASIEQHLNKAPFIKVAMYLQTDELKNKKAFDKIMPVMTNADVDIIVFQNIVMCRLSMRLPIQILH